MFTVPYQFSSLYSLGVLLKYFSCKNLCKSNICIDDRFIRIFSIHTRGGLDAKTVYFHIPLSFILS